MRLTSSQYKWVALILAMSVALIMFLEVSAYYVPWFVASPRFVPALLVMSAAKFAIAVFAAVFTVVYLIKRRVKA